ncbi:hypothetical protein Taro_041307 [Colocasia esculenta]|uniref:Uncharacterized protein n=1 Tax=Colocasia esculenta TaxID=4460 RepID=A0A843WT38_COLES|nr:hypothetical protein [Colocasia esculenta]
MDRRLLNQKVTWVSSLSERDSSICRDPTTNVGADKLDPKNPVGSDGGKWTADDDRRQRQLVIGFLPTVVAVGGCGERLVADWSAMSLKHDAGPGDTGGQPRDHERGLVQPPAAGIGLAEYRNGSGQGLEMQVKEELLGGGGDDEAAVSAQPPPHPQDAEAVGEMVTSLNRRRMYREVTLALRSALRDAVAEFSFLRLRGLRNLLKSLQSVAGNDAAIPLFLQSQSIPELQVLFQSTLRQSKDKFMLNLDHIFGVEPLKINSPATDSEVALALRVLEGCCLLHRESRDLAHQHKAIKDFEACRGIDKIAELMKDEQVDESIRWEAGGLGISAQNRCFRKL